MSGSLNKVILIGNLGRDPETRTTPSGAKVSNFTIATTERYTDKQGQKVDKTEWHRIVMWRGLADVAEKYLKKGSMVCIEGKLTTRTWDDKDGKKMYTTEIIADQMKMLGGKVQEERPQSAVDNYQANQQGAEPFKASDFVPPAPEDDLPF